MTFRIDEDLLQGRYELRDRDGMNTNEAVRRAVRQSLVQKGVLAPAAPLAKAARKRADTRKRA